MDHQRAGFRRWALMVVLALLPLDVVLGVIGIARGETVHTIVLDFVNAGVAALVALGLCQQRRS